MTPESAAALIVERGIVGVLCLVIGGLTFALCYIYRAKEAQQKDHAEVLMTITTRMFENETKLASTLVGIKEAIALQALRETLGGKSP